MSKTRTVKLFSDLANIPANKLPSSLCHNIKLDNIQEIVLRAKLMVSGVGKCMQFFRKYAPDIRYHNPHLKIVKERTGPNHMQIKVKPIGEENYVTMSWSNCETPEAIKDALIKLNDSLKKMPPTI